MGYTYDYKTVKQNLEGIGIYLDTTEEEYKGVTLTPLYAHDSDGYKYQVTYDRALRSKNHAFDTVHKSNPFSIDNINHYLKLNNVNFVCISDEYIAHKKPLLFKCLNCGEIVETTWCRINKNESNRRHIVCPNCGKRNESLHALVLKQMFLHEYPDTIVEEKSYRNPNTGKICPTDIVNHRLKIAIEIQSQWHDFPDIREKDRLKKQHWVDKGYNFYDPDIRDYTVLQLCQLFYDIDAIPSYIDYHYSDCINAKQIQELLDQGKTITEIVEITGVSRHRIHDAHATGKIEYPEYYSNVVYKPVTQYSMDHEYITDYKTIADGARAVNGNAGHLRCILRRGDHIYKGFYWEYKVS